MRTYAPKKTRTKLTTRLLLTLMLILVSVGITLILARWSSSTGLKQVSVPSVSPTSQSTQDISDTASEVTTKIHPPVPTQPELPPKPVSTPELTPEPEPEPVAKYTSEEFTMVVRTVYGEANICSDEERALVAWCICNRCDAWDKSISEVVNHTHFHGYNPDNPTPEDVCAVVDAVLTAWSKGETPATYPPYATTTGYLYFWGDGLHNYFREEF